MTGHLRRRLVRVAAAAAIAGGGLAVAALGRAQPVGAVHPATLVAEYSCSADHVSFLANDDGSQEFSGLGSGTLVIAGPAGVVPHDPADGHAFTWTWQQTGNDYNAQNIGKVKIQDPDGLLLPTGLYTVSQTFRDQTSVAAQFAVPNPTPAAGCPAAPPTPAPNGGGTSPTPPAGSAAGGAAAGGRSGGGSPAPTASGAADTPAATAPAVLDSPPAADPAGARQAAGPSSAGGFDLAAWLPLLVAAAVVAAVVGTAAVSRRWRKPQAAAAGGVDDWHRL